MKYRAVSRRTGFSLVEVMVAMALFGMLAMAFSLTTIFSNRAAAATMAESTALAVSSSYLEQLKSVNYNSIVASVRDPAGTPLQMVKNDGTPDPLFLDRWNARTIILDQDASGNATHQMVISVMPTIVDQSSITGERILNITIRYEWTRPGARGAGATIQRTLRSARSFVPSY